MLFILCIIYVRKHVCLFVCMFVLSILAIPFKIEFWGCGIEFNSCFVFCSYSFVCIDPMHVSCSIGILSCRPTLSTFFFFSPCFLLRLIDLSVILPAGRLLYFKIQNTFLV